MYKKSRKQENTGTRKTETGEKKLTHVTTSMKTRKKMHKGQRYLGTREVEKGGVGNL